MEKEQVYIMNENQNIMDDINVLIWGIIMRTADIGGIIIDFIDIDVSENSWNWGVVAL